MDNSNNSSLLVNAFLSNLVGLECWSVIAGSGTGSMATFDFGKKIERKRPLNNLNLTPIAREYYGEFSIFIQEADWRLGQDKETICTNHDKNDNDGLMTLGLKKLIGRKIISVNLLNENLNFGLSFNEGFFIEVTCIYKSDDFFDNYSLHTLARILSVNGDGQLTIEKK